MDKAASGLLSIGLCKGDRLGMWGPNSYAWVLMQLATAQAGIVLVRWSLPGTGGMSRGTSLEGRSGLLGPEPNPFLATKKLGQAGPALCPESGEAPDTEVSLLAPQVSVNPAYQPKELEYALKKVGPVPGGGFPREHNSGGLPGITEPDQVREGMVGDTVETERGLQCTEGRAQ